MTLIQVAALYGQLNQPVYVYVTTLNDPGAYLHISQIEMPPTQGWFLVYSVSLGALLESLHLPAPELLKLLPAEVKAQREAAIEELEHQLEILKGADYERLSEDC